MTSNLENDRMEVDLQPPVTESAGEDVPNSGNQAVETFRNLYTASVSGHRIIYNKAKAMAVVSRVAPNLPKAKAVVLMKPRPKPK